MCLFDSNIELFYQGAAVGCLSLALSTSPSSSHVRDMLFEEVSAGEVLIIQNVFKYLKKIHRKEK